MTKTRAVKWWALRRKMYRLYNAFKHGHWRLIWDIKPCYISIRIVEPGPDDFRGIPQVDDDYYEEVIDDS